MVWTGLKVPDHRLKIPAGQRSDRTNVLAALLLNTQSHGVHVCVHVCVHAVIPLLF